MTDKLSVADVLDRAATLIEPEGAWTQGNYGLFVGSTCWCAVGAIAVALGAAHGNEAEIWVNSVARPVIGMSADRLEEWNDGSTRTQSQVVSKLREAANLARERGL